MIQIFFAFIAGILTVAAPCILLPLPIVLGGAVGQNKKARPLFLVLGFILSFSLLALFFNFLISVFGLSPNALRTGAAILLALFAIFMIWPKPFELFMARFNSLIGLASRTGQAAGGGNIGGFILGTIIGIVWAPCAGPILGSILTLIAVQENVGQAGGLLVSYAIGASLPMLLIAYGGQALTTKIKGLAKYSQRLQQVFGIILIFLAAAVYFQYDTFIQAKILAAFPGFSTNIESRLIDRFRGNQELKGIISAPELTGISRWLNSDPLTIEGLRGKVVLIDFWTYSCINCVRTLPYVISWHEKYQDDGLVVIGVHTPEFAFERETENVEKAISQYKISYPVAQDNEFSTWRAYDNHYWPAKYLIDQEGNIVYTHFGEGKYEETENTIRRLLGLSGNIEMAKESLNPVQSPEMYLGTDRQRNLSSGQLPAFLPMDYQMPGDLNINEWALEGRWKFSRDRIGLAEGKGKIKLSFSAAKVFIVAQSFSEPATLDIIVDGRIQPSVTVDSPGLYTLFDSDEYSGHVMEIIIPEAGFEAFTFTFG